MSASLDISQKSFFPTSLDDRSRTKIAENINQLVADIFGLYVKTKNFHWHMSGSHFRDYHLLLDEQAAQIFDMIDILAERVRKLGKETIHSIGQIAQLQKIKDSNQFPMLPHTMLEDLMHDNKILTQSMRSAHELCSNHKDVATTSLLENFIDETERRVWFLFETLQNH